MTKILDYLNKDMKKPQLYGSFMDSWFQYLFLIILVVMSVVSIKKMKGINDKKLNIILLGAGIILIVFEIYKQVIFSYQSNWDYMWYAFPFQFCSVAMYLAPFTAFIRNKKIKDSAITFLATYSFFSGSAVMLYPATVYVTTIGINIQTMVHHGTLCVLGIGLLVNHVKFNWKTFIGSMLVFAVFLGIAIILNTIHNNFIQDGTFNMFFVNPKSNTGLPILELIQPKVSGTVFIIIYYFGFSLVAFIIFGLAKLILSKQKKLQY